jgi:hypothetical protein
MHDTTRSIEERMTRMMALKSPAERLSMAGSMFDASKKLMTAGLLKENPGLSAAGLREGIFRRLYGDCFTESELQRVINGKR